MIGQPGRIKLKKAAWSNKTGKEYGQKACLQEQLAAEALLFHRWNVPEVCRTFTRSAWRLVSNPTLQKPVELADRTVCRWPAIQSPAERGERETGGEWSRQQGSNGRHAADWCSKTCSVQKTGNYIWFCKGGEKKLMVDSSRIWRFILK